MRILFFFYFPIFAIVSAICFKKNGTNAVENNNFLSFEN